MALCCIDTASETLLGDFLTSLGLAKLSGDYVLVDPTLEVSPLSFRRKQTNRLSPSLAQFIGKLRPLYVYTDAAAVLLLLLCARLLF
jgi:hypothetical protein